MTRRIVYLDGDYLPGEEARVSVDDRGFLFSDAVYEVTPVYGGRCFMLERHLERLANNLGLLSISFDVAALAEVHTGLIECNRLDGAALAIVYTQVTRGAAPRGHAFPSPAVPPTVYAFATEVARQSAAEWEAGGSAVTVADQRWARPEIKTTALLPNVLAQQDAIEQGATDAIFLRDGMALEGPHANLFAVQGDVLVTAPASNYILHGITRTFLLELAAELNIPVEEKSFSREELLSADEVFLSSTVTEIKPLLRIDGHAIGTGSPGSVTRRLYEAFRRSTASDA